MTTNTINEIIEVSVETLDLTTPDGCIAQIVSGWNKVQQGYGLADDAIAAYLNLPGMTARSLFEDLQAAGCGMSLKTIRNRQTRLRLKGSVPEASKGRRSDVDAKAQKQEQLNAELFKIGKEMEATGKRMQLCIKPEELRTASPSQMDELIETVVENVFVIRKSKRFYEDNLDGLVSCGYKPSEAYQHIREMDELEAAMKQAFSPIFASSLLDDSD